MKVFVATKRGQGIRKNDFCHAAEGEPVKFVFECDGETVDGSCGCKRSMGGVKTHLATTTMEVLDFDDMTLERYAKLLYDSDTKGGWKPSEEESKSEAEELARLAAAFDVGDLVEKRGKALRERKPKR